MSSGLSAGLRLGGRFVLIRALGSGGFGEVWLARDPADPDGPVALKLLKPEHRNNPRIAARFEREAAILMGLDHPNIAKAKTFALDGNAGLIAMEFVDGQPLSAFLGEHSLRRVQLEESLLTMIVGTLAAALDHAHGLGIVHRDLCPKNILLVPKHEPTSLKILDFGVAKVLTDDEPGEATTAGRQLGTLSYLAPEQIGGGTIGPATDVFALGVIIFELLTLHRPWLRTDNGAFASFAETRRPPQSSRFGILDRIARGPRPVPSQARPGLSRALDEVVARALSIDPRARPFSAGELFEELKAALRSSALPDDASLRTEVLRTGAMSREEDRPPLEPVMPRDLALGDDAASWTRDARDDEPQPAGVMELASIRREPRLAPILSFFAVLLAVSLIALVLIDRTPSRKEELPAPSPVVVARPADAHPQPSEPVEDTQEASAEDSVRGPVRSRPPRRSTPEKIPEPSRTPELARALRAHEAALADFGADPEDPTLRLNAIAAITTELEGMRPGPARTSLERCLSLARVEAQGRSAHAMLVECCRRNLGASQ